MRLLMSSLLEARLGDSPCDERGCYNNSSCKPRPSSQLITPQDLDGCNWKWKKKSAKNAMTLKLCLSKDMSNGSFWSGFWGG